MFEFFSVAVRVLKAVKKPSGNGSEVITTGKKWRKAERTYKE